MSEASAKPANILAVDSIRRIFGRKMPPLNRRERLAIRLTLLLMFRRCRVENPEHLDHPGPMIVAANHLNSLESALTPCFLIWLRGGHKVHFMIDWMYLYVPIFGWMARTGGSIPVWRKKARYKFFERIRENAEQRDPVEVSREILERGGWLGIYPEATRNRDPHRLRPGHRGVARLALSTGAPVLPVGIDFEGRGSAQKVPSYPRMIYRIGTPLRFEEEVRLARSQEGKRTSAVREAEKQVTLHVMEAISGLSGKAPAEEKAPSEPRDSRRIGWREPKLRTRS